VLCSKISAFSVKLSNVIETGSQSNKKCHSAIINGWLPDVMLAAVLSAGCCKAIHVVLKVI